MIRFDKLVVRNFLSYGDVPTVVDFSDTGVMLISGLNGCGKSSIISALVYCLYNEALSGCSVDELINNINKQYMEVSVTFYKPGNGYYKVIRARKMKSGQAGNYVKLFHNKTECVFDESMELTLDGNRTTDQLIVSTLGISYEMFSRMIVISCNNTPFLDLPVSSTTASSQTGFIERLFDLHILTEKSTLLKNSIKSTEDSIKQHIAKIESILKEQDRLDMQKVNAKAKADNHEVDKQQSIYRYVSELEKINGINVDHERMHLDSAKKVKSDLAEIKKQQNELSTQYSKQLSLKQKHEKELASLNDSKCPYCDQHYHNEHKIKECISIVESCDTNINEMMDYLDELDKDMNDKLLAYEEAMSKVSVTDVEELINLKNKIEWIQNKIEDLQSSKNVYLEQLTELEQIELDPVNYDDLNKLKEIVVHQQFLLKLLSKKDSFIRKNLLSSNLSYLNTRLQHYLSDLDLPYVIEFNSNMTADISYLGRKLSFNNLSNGQKARVNIGLMFAFRDVRQKMSYPVNILIVDEAIDSNLDSAGISAAISILKRKAFEDQILIGVVTHRDEVTNLFDKVMSVSMENDFSKITYSWK